METSGSRCEWAAYHAILIVQSSTTRTLGLLTVGATDFEPLLKLIGPRSISTSWFPGSMIAFFAPDDNPKHYNSFNHTLS
eukprot:UN03691